MLVARATGSQEGRAALRRPRTPQRGVPTKAIHSSRARKGPAVLLFIDRIRSHWLTDGWTIAKAQTMRCVVILLFLTIAIFNGISRVDAAEPEKIPGIPDRAVVLSAPRPEYPYEARRAKITGTGIVVLEVDPATGKVTSARMEPSTGSAILDRAALWAFRRWRFKPGAVKMAKMPITFTTTGNVVTEMVVKKKPMDEALERFLGKGTIIKGPIPEYPRSLSWTDKTGKGVYELHVQKDGRVSDVRIMKRSGDDTFDRVTVRTLRKWRLRRGPLTLELPLSFKLTPTKYSVEIPKDR